MERNTIAEHGPTHDSRVHMDNHDVTRSEVMEIVETFDRYESTGTAWYNADENGVYVKATVTADSVFDAMDEAVMTDGFDAGLQLNDGTDDLIVLEVTGGDNEDDDNDSDNTEPVEVTPETFNELVEGDEVTINNNGRAMDGGTYTVTNKKDRNSYEVVDEDGDKGWMVRTYAGENRVHIKGKAGTQNFSLMQVN